MRKNRTTIAATASDDQELLFPDQETAERTRIRELEGRLDDGQMMQLMLHGVLKSVLALIDSSKVPDKEGLLWAIAEAYEPFVGIEATNELRYVLGVDIPF